MIRWAIVALATTGLIISTYFTAVAYRWVRPDVSWVPRFCRLDEEGCASIVFTPRARLLGPPNSVLGQIYYLALLAAAASGVLDLGPWRYGLLAAAGATVALGAFLTYSLLFVTRVRCHLCFATHAINLALLNLLLAA